MCDPCDAADARLAAAISFRQAAVSKYGTWDREGLMGLYPVRRTLPETITALLDKLDQRQG